MSRVGRSHARRRRRMRWIGDGRPTFSPGQHRTHHDPDRRNRRRAAVPKRTAARLTGARPALPGQVRLRVFRSSGEMRRQSRGMDLLPLFVETVEDLRIRSSLTSSPYDAIQAAGLMRRLLLDEQAVGPRSESALRTRGWYSEGASFSWTLVMVLDGTARESPAPVIGAMLDPSLSEARFRAARDPLLDFWQETVLRTGPARDLLNLPLVWGQTGDAPAVITTRELIRHLAHAMGGVHHGQSHIEPPELLTTAIREGLPRILWTMRALGRVVVRGYEPLVCASILRGDYTGGGFTE